MVAEALCNAPEDQPLKDLRINELTADGAAVCIEGFAPATRRR